MIFFEGGFLQLCWPEVFELKIGIVCLFVLILSLEIEALGKL